MILGGSITLSVLISRHVNHSRRSKWLLFRGLRSQLCYLRELLLDLLPQHFVDDVIRVDTGLSPEHTSLKQPQDVPALSVQPITRFLAARSRLHCLASPLLSSALFSALVEPCLHSSVPTDSRAPSLPFSLPPSHLPSHASMNACIKSAYMNACIKSACMHT